MPDHPISQQWQAVRDEGFMCLMLEAALNRANKQITRVRCEHAHDFVIASVGNDALKLECEYGRTVHEPDGQSGELRDPRKMPAEMLSSGWIRERARQF